MKIVIPGGSGQVGMLLARKFHSDGYDVRASSLNSPPGKPRRKTFANAGGRRDKWLRGARSEARGKILPSGSYHLFLLRFGLRAMFGAYNDPIMKYRNLGRTGLNVSTLGLGGVAFGDMYGTMGPGVADACVRKAIDLGINLIDTSPFYGQTRSESVLGDILADGLRDKIFLCSKAGRNTATDFDFSPAAMERSVEASLKRLRTDHLDVLIAHDIEFVTDFEPIFTETAAVLHKLKAAGKCRFIGMSGHPLGILRTAIERCKLDVVISYTHFTLQNQRLLTEVLPTAEQHGVGVINASPLTMGLLSDAGAQDWHPAPAIVRAAGKQAAALCKSRGVSIAKLGMQFCTREERISATLTGASQASEVEANVKALETPIDEGLLREVQAILAPVMNVTWASGNWPLQA